MIKKIKDKYLSNAPYAKIRNDTSILYKNRFHRVEVEKSKFYYNCLKYKNISRGSMETILRRTFNFNNSKFVWSNIYKQKLTDLDIAKVEEFNFEVLHNILPCGKVLSKWLKTCTEQCMKCKELETMEHMPFGFEHLSNIWEAISGILKVNVKWKNIVCGFPSSESNKNVRFINILISIVSYSIFKFSNKRHWNDHVNCNNVSQMIVRDILFYKLVLKCKQDNIMDDVRIDKIVTLLLTVNS